MGQTNRRRSAAGLLAATAGLLLAMAGPSRAADYPAPHEADWVAPSFTFHTGEVMHNMRLHYTTVGDPSGMPVLVLHGTAGSGTGMLSPGFAGQLFGPGQALDATKYYVILPDCLGAGKSAKPSDGLRAAFPRYDYDDAVLAQYRLLTEGMGLHHLRLIIGNSMGGMQTWVWGVHHPGFMDALVPMASQPTAMSSRNWMMRRMLVESIRHDPGYDNGNYKTQPASLPMVNVFFGIATNGGSLAYQAMAPTRAKADALVDHRLAQPFKADANDVLYQWDSSRDFDEAPGLERITAATLAINSADDERNPPETGIEVAALKRVHNAQLYLVPASAETRGHGTTGMAKFWHEQLGAFLAKVPVGAM